MPNSVAYPGCCSASMITGFPFDNPAYGTKAEITAIRQQIVAAEKNHQGPLRLITLNDSQKVAQQAAQDQGYVCVGRFITSHDLVNEKVSLWAKGLRRIKGKIKPLKKPPKAKLKKLKVTRILLKGQVFEDGD